jgi:hypothetical protein
MVVSPHEGNHVSIKIHHTSADTFPKLRVRTNMGMKRNGLKPTVSTRPKKRLVRQLPGIILFVFLVAFVGTELGFFTIPYPSDIGRMRTLHADINRLATSNDSSKLVSQKSTWSKKPHESSFTNSWTDLSVKANFTNRGDLKSTASSWLDALKSSGFKTENVSCYVAEIPQPTHLETAHPDEIRIGGYQTSGNWTLDFGITIKRRPNGQADSVVALFAPSHGKAQRFPGFLRTGFKANAWIC